MKDTSEFYEHPERFIGPAKERWTFSGKFDAPNAGQKVLRGAMAGDSPIYIRMKRSWRDRLFSWPWRPWQAYVGPAVRMRMQGEPTRDDDGNLSVTFQQDD